MFMKVMSLELHIYIVANYNKTIKSDGAQTPNKEGKKHKQTNNKVNKEKTKSMNLHWGY